MFKKSLLTMAVASFLVAGCGSSGSSDTGSTSVATGPSKIEGTAAKGIIISGIVTAFAVDASGAETEVGSGTTDDKGAYSITLDDSYDNSLPIRIKLTAGPDTEMLCDAASCGTGVDTGDTISLAGTSFELSAISKSVAGGETAKTAITPFTSMADSIASSNTTIDDTSVAAAQSQVKNLLGGLDFVDTDPVDISDTSALSAASTEQQQYTILLSALAEQAFEDTSNDGVTIDDVINNISAFNDDAEDGTFGDEDLDLVALFNEAADIATSNPNISDEAEAETTTDANALEELAEANNGIITPVATDDGTLDDIALAKGFVSEIRTWANAMEDLESPAELFLDEAKTTNETLNSNAKAVFEVAAQSIDAVVQEIDSSIKEDRELATSVSLYNDDDELVGTITLTDNSTTDASSIAMEASDLNGVALDGSISASARFDAETFAAGDISGNFAGSASNADSKITLADAAFTMTLAEAVDLNQGGFSETTPGGMALKGKLTVEALSSGISTGDSISADAEIKLVSLNSGKSLNNDMNLSLQKLALNDLSVTNAAGSTAGLSASIEMDNAASFDTFTYLDSGSVIEKSLNDFNINDFDLSDARTAFGISSFNNLQYYGWDNLTCASGYDENQSWISDCKNGDVGNLNSELTDLYANSDYDSIKSVNLAYFDYYAGGGYINGYSHIELDDMETAENFLEATINITGMIDLADHEKVALSITANKTGLKDGNLTGTLAYDGKSMSLTATTTGGESENTDGTLTFSNADGVAMTVTNDDDWTSGSVTVGDSVVGSIETLNDNLIMRYNDGTFESL